MNNLTNIILNNEKLIYYIINKYTRYYDKEDLYQAGVIGMIKAYKNYKNNSKTKFSTYAFPYILGEVIKYINSNSNFKLSKDYVRLGKKINEAKIILSQKLMKEPSSYELSLFLNIDESFIIDVINANQEIDRLDKEITKDGKNLYLYDVVSDNNNYYDINTMLLNEEINKLSNDEKDLVKIRYFNDRTQSETASILGTSQVQVSRNEKKILSKLKIGISS